jgi:hypothetical protein
MAQAPPEAAICEAATRLGQPLFLFLFLFLNTARSGKK